MKNKEKGELVEQIVTTELMKLGVVVSKPIGDNQPYDIIIDWQNKLYKCQIRTCSFTETGAVRLPLQSSRLNSKIQYKVCNKEKIDFYIGYCFETNKCYIIETSNLINTNNVCFQTKDKTLSGQSKGIRIASEYEIGNYFK